MKTEIEKKFLKYPSTAQFRVIDSIGIPHPYMITERHIFWASARFSGMLGKECIEDAERNEKARCGMKGCTLSYKEHEQALLIECPDEEMSEELHDALIIYLGECKDMAEEEGFAGFAFKRGNE